MRNVSVLVVPMAMDFHYPVFAVRISSNIQQDALRPSPPERQYHPRRQ